MAATTEMQIDVTSSGDGIDSEWLPTKWSNSNGAAGGPYKVSLATGVNVLTVPTGAIGVVLLPPAASQSVLTLNGPSGMPMRTGHAAAVPIATGTATLSINSTREDLVYVYWG